MNITTDQINQAIAIAGTALEVALPSVGLAAFDPLVPALEALAVKINEALASHTSQAALRAAVAAANVAADAAEAAKFPTGSP